MSTVRWNVGGGSVHAHASTFCSAVDQAKTAAAGMSETELSDLIDEAVQWVRELMRVILDTNVLLGALISRRAIRTTPCG